MTGTIDFAKHPLLEGLTKYDIDSYELSPVCQFLECIAHIFDADQSAQALAVLTGMSAQETVCEEILQTIIYCLMLNSSYDENGNSSSYFKYILQNLRQKYSGQNKPDCAVEELSFYLRHLPKALDKMAVIPAVLLDNLTKVLGRVLDGFSDEEVSIILLYRSTPAWLCKAILSCRTLNCFVNSVYMPDSFQKITDTSPEANTRITQMTKLLCSQTEKTLKWFLRCEPEHLPPKIEPFSGDLQSYAYDQARHLIKNWPIDKLLALSLADFLPVWLRKAAETRFAEKAPVIAASRANRTARRKKKNKKSTKPGCPSDI